MLEIIVKAIEQFYKKRDFKLFRLYSTKPLNLDEQLKNYVSSQGFKLVEETDGIDSSRGWYIEYSYKKDNFEILYTTKLEISKIAPLFYIGHTFEVNNKDKNRIGLTLDGFGGKPYSKKQLRLHEIISVTLEKKGYFELSDLDMRESVEGFKMPEDVTIFGPNVTVERLLFGDVYNILGDDY